jgi:hypothetical protein
MNGHMNADRILREAARMLAADPALGEEFFQRAGIVPITRGRRARLRRLAQTAGKRAEALEEEAADLQEEEEEDWQEEEVARLRGWARQDREDARVARRWLDRYEPPRRRNPLGSRPSADYVLRQASRILAADPGLLREFLLHTGPRRVLEEMGIAPFLHVVIPHAYDEEERDFVGTFDEWRDFVRDHGVYEGDVSYWELYLGRRLGRGWRSDASRTDPEVTFPATGAEELIARRGEGDGSWWMGKPPEPPRPPRKKKKKKRVTKKKTGRRMTKKKTSRRRP